MGRSLIISGLVVAPLLLSVLLSPGVSGALPLSPFAVGLTGATVLTANQLGALIAVGLAIKVVAIKAALIGGAPGMVQHGQSQTSQGESRLAPVSGGT